MLFWSFRAGSPVELPDLLTDRQRPFLSVQLIESGTISLREVGCGSDILKNSLPDILAAKASNHAGDISQLLGIFGFWARQGLAPHAVLTISFVANKLGKPLPEQSVVFGGSRYGGSCNNEENQDSTHDVTATIRLL